ncbi:heme A synthase [Synechococcus sp. RSCCF101]|uniref:COX15/CtaA family protein n=1 Tax=Synechococcus sp. RSCCF101 TaxID=2511069 RepID=UPI00351A2DE9
MSIASDHDELGRFVRVSGHLVPALVALVVIGGATRVMEAGLACPDWPLCYGSLLPGRQMNLQVFLEWFHRLDAFVIGVSFVVMQVVAVVRRRQLPVWVPYWMTALLSLVLIQGGLGALTVLALLPAAVVTGHLVTALLLVAVLSAGHQALRRDWLPGQASDPAPSTLWWAATLPVLLLVTAQCLIGG